MIKVVVLVLVGANINVVVALNHFYSISIHVPLNARMDISMMVAYVRTVIVIVQHVKMQYNVHLV